MSPVYEPRKNAHSSAARHTASSERECSFECDSIRLHRRERVAVCHSSTDSLTLRMQQSEPWIDTFKCVWLLTGKLRGMVSISIGCYHHISPGALGPPRKGANPSDPSRELPHFKWRLHELSTGSLRYLRCSVTVRWCCMIHRPARVVSSALIARPSRREDLRSGGHRYQLFWFLTIPQPSGERPVIHHTCAGEDMRFRLSTEVIRHACAGEDMRFFSCTLTKIPEAHNQLRRPDIAYI